DPLAEVARQADAGGLTAPMNASVVAVSVAVGDAVEAGAPLVVLEAMKMEHSIRAPRAGVVAALFCSPGELVAEGAPLVELEEVAP
ncbi:acetyl-CoA carboxylase biotin carboxyl carrier protein subunit, partial [Pseudomonas oryzihabitans]|nr:3-methylcrotonyl-CoA carboxylase [Pseudomonas oryzihabitans]